MMTIKPVAASSLPTLDERFMRATIDYSRRHLGLTAPNPCVGALVVRDGAIYGRGITAPNGRPHAERIALEQAGAFAQGATLYVTLEPCARRSRTGDGPSCTDAILAAGIARVVVAATDPSPFAAGEGVKRLKANGIAVETGVLAEEAQRLHRGHALRVTAHRPLVQVKLAETQDGYAATAERQPLAITGEQARNYVHLLRAKADAILVGIGTVLADDPQLTCRLPGLRQRSPIRVVLDSALRLPLHSQLVKSAREVPVWAIAGVNAPVAREWALRSEGVEVLRVAETAPGRLDLVDALGLLADWGVTRLMVEGGPETVASLAEAGFVDEVVLFTGAWSLGQAPGLRAVPEALAKLLGDDRNFRLDRDEKIGPDTLRMYERLL